MYLFEILNGKDSTAAEGAKGFFSQQPKKIVVKRFARLKISFLPKSR
jgi:hypothetical protein